MCWTHEYHLSKGLSVQSILIDHDHGDSIVTFSVITERAKLQFCI